MIQTIRNFVYISKTQQFVVPRHDVLAFRLWVIASNALPNSGSLHCLRSAVMSFML